MENEAHTKIHAQTISSAKLSREREGRKFNLVAFSKTARLPNCLQPKATVISVVVEQAY